MEKETLIKKIEKAKNDNIKLFIQGLIHEYSHEKEINGEKIYLPNRRYNSLIKKKVLSDKEIITLIQPKTILLECYDSNQEYSKNKITSRFKEELLNPNRLYGSPNLVEIVKDVKGIKVRGADFTYPEIYKIQSQLQFSAFNEKIIYDVLREICKERNSYGNLKDEQKELMESHLKKLDFSIDLSNPNSIYFACKSITNLLLDCSSFLCGNIFFNDYKRIFELTKNKFMMYMKQRDTRMYRVIKEELEIETPVLLKVGYAHMDSNISYLPIFLLNDNIKYFYLHNVENHTLDEIQKSNKFLSSG